MTNREKVKCKLKRYHFLTVFVPQLCMAEPVSAVLVGGAAAVTLVGCGVRGAKWVYGKIWGKSENDTSEKKALAVAEEEKKRLQEEVRLLREQSITLYQQLSRQEDRGCLLEDQKKALEEKYQGILEKLKIVGRELYYSYLKCLEALSKEQCAFLEEAITRKT